MCDAHNLHHTVGSMLMGANVRIVGPHKTHANWRPHNGRQGGPGVNATQAPDTRRAKGPHTPMDRRPVNCECIVTHIDTWVIHFYLHVRTFICVSKFKESRGSAPAAGWLLSTGSPGFRLSLLAPFLERHGWGESSGHAMGPPTIDPYMSTDDD